MVTTYPDRPKEKKPQVWAPVFRLTPWFTSWRARVGTGSQDALLLPSGESSEAGTRPQEVILFIDGFIWLGSACRGMVVCRSRAVKLAAAGWLERRGRHAECFLPGAVSVLAPAQ